MKKGVNLGCGKIILPCARPAHHQLIPEWVYGEGIEWDNVDWNPGEGVNKVVDLFDYPWREKDDLLPPFNGPITLPDINLRDSTYDVVIAAHIVEHIPHHIVEHGKFVHRHPLYQDGWFAWFAELWRILKPGGKAYILVPFAWSNGAISDPTHTRYLTPATFNYFNAPDNGSPFEYRMQQRWDVALNPMPWAPNHNAWERLADQLGIPAGASASMELLSGAVWNNAQFMLNHIVEFMVEMTAVKDESSS